MQVHQVLTMEAHITSGGCACREESAPALRVRPSLNTMPETLDILLCKRHSFIAYQDSHFSCLSIVKRPYGDALTFALRTKVLSHEA